MTSLRETIETTFAAAAFAERNLDQDARTVLGNVASERSQADATRPDAKTRRPRPSLKA